MGLSQIKLQRYEDAIKILRVAISLDPNLEYAYFYSESLSYCIDFKLGQGCSYKTIQLKSDFADAHLELVSSIYGLETKPLLWNSIISSKI